MTSDLELYRQHHVDGLTYEDIAAKYELSVDSVRGRISRLNISQRTSVMQNLATKAPLENTFLAKQREIIARAEVDFQERQELLADVDEPGMPYTAIFVSDLHLPYTDWKAVELALAIIADVKPEFVSGYNDLFDFTGYGRWLDTRPPAAQLWDDNIDNAIKTAAEWHRTIKRFSPETLILQVLGNHDKWLFQYLRTERNGYTEKNIWEFMGEMENQGVLQFTNAETNAENVIKISPGLKWVHGASTAALLSTVGKNTIERMGEDGLFFNTVAGHTHRSGEVKHLGVKHWNAGKLCIDDMSYLKHPGRWDTGIVINEFYATSREVSGTIVDFKRRGSTLTAEYKGVKYTV